jgi:dATP/dGTP diphosphohydrolase
MTTSDNTNPKDLIGIKKPQVGLLPGAGKLYGALAMQDGAVKYGPYNWRDKKVRYTVYLDALERHLLALRDHEDLAPDSGLPHLGHIIACASILADAVEGGFIIDDRPLPGPTASIIAKYTKG